MYCPYCGTKLETEANFCFNCGEKLELNNDVKEENKKDIKEESVNTNQRLEEGVAEDTVKESDSQYQQMYEKANEFKKNNSEFARLKEKAVEYWNQMDIFCRVATLVVGFAVIILFFSILEARIIPIILSVIQIAVAVVAVCIHIGKIKSKEKWVKYVILVVAVVVATINMRSCGNENVDKAFSRINVPYGFEECNGKEYDIVLYDFIGVGFYNVSENAIEDLTLENADLDGLVESVTINGKGDFDRNDDFFASANIVVNYHTFKQIEAPIDFEAAKTMEVEEIIEIFESAGFSNIATEEKYDLDPDEVSVEFENEVIVDRDGLFEKGDKFPINAEISIIIHRPYEKHTLKLEIDFWANLLFNTYDVKMEIGDESKVLKHGEDGAFEFGLGADTYTIIFTNVSDDEVYGVATLEFTGDTNAKYKINCYGDRVAVEEVYVERLSEVGETQAMVSKSAVDYKYENYKDVEKDLKSAGFTNIQTKILYDIVWGWTANGEVDSVSIDGNKSFNRGDIFEKDASVVITYHMPESDDPNRKEETTSSDEKDSQTEESKNTETQNNVTDESESESKSLYYSTNDYETARKGNTGVFAYVNRGPNYDVYWIIDFDAGYVYYFTEGNGSEECDRLKIDSGDLNTAVTVTYHADGMEWSNLLHFKYVEHPETLIVIDGNELQFEYTTTNLYKALSLRNSKTIVDY